MFKIQHKFSNIFRYENGGFDSSLTPAQLQQIRRISFAQVLCRTLDSIETVQPFVFLSSNNPDNDRVSCHNGLLNNFDLSPWVEIDSDSDNDISKSDENTATTKPKRKSTTAKPTTTTKKTSQKGASKLTQKNPNNNLTSTIKDITKETATNKIDKNKLSKDDDELNLNLSDITSSLTINTTKEDTTTEPDMTTKPDMTKPDTPKPQVQIDDKLDFKNKSRLVDDLNVDSRHRPNKYDDYDYDDEETQQVQSVVVNNVVHKRPYNQRPVITVTENINKYTYLINYVPRSTESWRQATRRPTPTPIRDRDVVKVTYQTYDDTYRRPNKPYYYDNRHEDLNYRYNRPSYTTKYNYHSSARSNDETVTQQNKATTKPDVANESTTDLYKLVTFGYVGTYKGNSPITEKPIEETHKEVAEKHETETVRKDFSTDKTENNMKLSTFFLYDTATKPYLQRPTRRNDEAPVQTNKYYYIRNVLHKYSTSEKIDTENETKGEKQEILKENYNNPGSPATIIEERSSLDKMSSLENMEMKRKNEDRHRNRVKAKPSTPAKTPSVAFDVIPSEIR